LVGTVAAIAMRPASFPAVYPASSHDGAGISKLRAVIARILAEHAWPLN
jgi:hypothetical protein